MCPSVHGTTVVQNYSKRMKLAIGGWSVMLMNMYWKWAIYDVSLSFVWSSFRCVLVDMDACGRTYHFPKDRGRRNWSCPLSCSFLPYRWCRLPLAHLGGLYSKSSKAFPHYAECALCTWGRLLHHWESGIGHTLGWWSSNYQGMSWQTAPTGCRLFCWYECPIDQRSSPDGWYISEYQHL